MSWYELQGAFAEAVRSPGRPVPTGVGPRKSSASEKRFNVYRNNSAVSLTEAMALGFPVVRELVGETFFTGMARAYVADNLPKSPVLLDYGDTFPEFIGRFEPAQSLPFLADVAHLECAWRRAYHAADQQALTVAALQDIDPQKLDGARLKLHASVQLVRSDWPVASIWHAHQLADADARTAALQALASRDEERAQNGEHVLIVRPAFEVSVQLVAGVMSELLVAFREGASLGEAAGGLDDDTVEHFGAMLSYAFGAGAVCAVDVN